MLMQRNSMCKEIALCPDYVPRISLRPRRNGPQKPWPSFLKTSYSPTAEVERPEPNWPDSPISADCNNSVSGAERHGRRLLMRRSIELVAAILGILKRRGAHLCPSIRTIRRTAWRSCWKIAGCPSSLRSQVCLPPCRGTRGARARPRSGLERRRQRAAATIRSPSRWACGTCLAYVIFHVGIERPAQRSDDRAL